MRQILEQYIPRSIKKFCIWPHLTCSCEFGHSNENSLINRSDKVRTRWAYKSLFELQTLNWLTLNQMSIINYLLLVVSPRIIKLVCCKIKLNKTSLLSYSQAVLISFRISETLMMLKIESSGRDQQICGLASRHQHFWDVKILI